MVKFSEVKRKITTDVTVCIQIQTFENAIISCYL